MQSNIQRRIKLLSSGGRLVGPLLPSTLSRIATETRTAYLTFDDGPTPDLTPPVLDLLDEFGAKATFFLTASRVHDTGPIVKRIVASGHTVGNHGLRHIDYWKVSRESCVADLAASDRILTESTGSAAALVRPPYGHVTPGLLAWCRRTRRTCVLWDVMTADFDYEGDARPFGAAVVGAVRHGSIIVLHDSAPAPVTRLALVRSVLTELRNAGWRIDSPIRAPTHHRRGL